MRLRIKKFASTGVVAFVLLALLAWAGMAMAQVNTADLSGTVLDPQGAAVPGAKVVVRNLATGITRTAETDSNGGYRFVALPPGRYELRVTATGFAVLQVPELVLTIGQSAGYNPTLVIATGTETVHVEESTTGLIEVERTAVAETVDTRRITNLPINGRNYVNFTLLTSQSQRDSAPSIGAAPTSGINFGGQRARSNQVSVDGADAVDNSVNGIRATVSQEAVQEFQLIISNYMPEFGRATGGVINIVTKGGSNDVHGNVFGYLRHKSIQARNPFSVEVDPATGALSPVKQGYTRVQAGATLGGPIKKDKTFYFFSYETTRRQETGFTDIGRDNFGLVSATFPFFPAPLTVTPQQQTFINTLLASGVPALQTLAGQYGVLAGSASNVALTGVDFGAVIASQGATPCATPPNCFPIPVGGDAVELPASYAPLRSVIGNFPVSEGTSLWSARLDHQWNEHNNSFVRVSVSPSLVTGIQVNAQSQNFGQNAGSRTSLQQARDFSVVGQHVTSFGNTLFNEARFQFARRGLHYGFANLPGGGNVAVDMLGFAHFGREPFSTVDRIERRFQFTDNVTWIKGKHTMKMGVDANIIQLRSKKEQIFELNFGGLYRFGALGATTFGFPSSVATPGGTVAVPGFSAPQTYGLGLPQIYIQGIGKSNKPFENYPVAAFWQDSWKIHPRLTLNFGVRYDVELTPVFPAATQLNQTAEAALNLVEGIPVDRNNVAPRIAIAWDPWGKGNTVVRAGYGIFYDHPLLAVAFNSTTAEGALSTQLLALIGAASRTAVTPLTAASVVNAASIFQGVLNAPANFGYLASEQRFDSKLSNSIFVNQNFIVQGIAIPILPFTLHVDGDFKYGYAQQANLTIEQKVFNDYKISVGYTYTHGLKLNRPRNITPTDPALLTTNFRNALAAGLTPPNPLLVSAPAANIPAGATCGVTVIAPSVLGQLTGCPGPLASLNGQFIGTAAIFNYFRPTGPNPSFAALFGAAGYGNTTTVGSQVFLANLAGYPTGIPNVRIPWSDVMRQESAGNSIYHGLTVSVSKRFTRHFEFLSSYTWSHAIDDSTDLQTLLAPQDNRRPDLERSNSSFDQRHRWVSSAVFESPFKRQDGGINWLLADFTVSPIIEVSSGRPFMVFTASDLNLDVASATDRPSVVPAGGSTTLPTATSPFLPGVVFTMPDVCDQAVQIPPAPVPIPPATSISPFVGCTGNLGRNAFTRPGFVSVDLRISRKFYFTERWNLEFITDIFNVANKFNVADVSLLCDPRDPANCQAGRPTAAFDPRQFQFALKLNW